MPCLAWLDRDLPPESRGGQAVETQTNHTRPQEGLGRLAVVEAASSPATARVLWLQSRLSQYNDSQVVTVPRNFLKDIKNFVEYYC